MKLRIFLGFIILAAAGHAQIVPGSTGHGQPSFNCAVNDTYGDIDTNLVWKCYTAPNGWAPTPYFQPYGGSASGTFKVPSLISSVQPVYSVLGYGAVGNGSTNDTAAIAAAATACGTTGGILFFPRTPGGAFTTTLEVDPPANCDIQIDGTLRATAAMASVVNIGASGRALRKHLYGAGVIDSNNLASRHILMTNFGHFEITGVTLFNSASIAGIDMQGSSNYEPFVHDMNLFVPSGVPDTVGNVGIWVDQSTDASVGPNIAIVGWDTGVKDSVGGAQPFKDIHVWGAVNNLPNTCFDSAHGNAQWVNDECDTPTAIGVRSRQFNDIIDHLRCYNNVAFGTDNVINCVQFDQASPNSIVTSSQFFDAGAGHRIGTDVSASSFATIITSGNQASADVVTQNAQNTSFKNFVIQPAAVNINRQGATDVAFAMNLNSGSTASQLTNINFLDRNSFKWEIFKDVGNSFQIFDVQQNANRFRMQPSGDMTFTNAAGAKFIFQVGLAQFLAGAQIGSTGSTINAQYKGSATLTYTSITAPGCQEQPLTFTGAVAGDTCYASTGATDIGITFSYAGCRVSAANTAQVKVCATATGTPTAATWTGWVTH